MKKPSFQFYPGDWRKDPNLSRASLEAKGAMIEIMCLAFDCEKRGMLKTGKHPWTVEEISHAIGGDKQKNISAIEELLKLNVLKKDKKATIFSSRMVKDDKLSKVRREAGFKGGNPNLVKHRVKQEVKQNPTPSSSSSSSSSIKEIYKEKIFTDQAFIEKLMMNWRLDDKQMMILLEDFELVLMAGNKTHESYSEYKSHFFNWGKKNYQKVLDMAEGHKSNNSFV